MFGEDLSLTEQINNLFATPTIYVMQKNTILFRSRHRYYTNAII